MPHHRHRAKLVRCQWVVEERYCSLTAASPRRAGITCLLQKLLAPAPLATTMQRALVKK